MILRTVLAFIILVCIIPAHGELFDKQAPTGEWAQFAAAGFGIPACGLIFDENDTVCAGLPLGGLGTGCLDIETSGVLGFSSIFRPSVMVDPTPYQTLRNPQLMVPFLGMSVGGQTWGFRERRRCWMVARSAAASIQLILGITLRMKTTWGIGVLRFPKLKTCERQRQFGIGDTIRLSTSTMTQTLRWRLASELGHRSCRGNGCPRLYRARSLRCGSATRRVARSRGVWHSTSQVRVLTKREASISSGLSRAAKVGAL